MFNEDSFKKVSLRFLILLILIFLFLLCGKYFSFDLESCQVFFREFPLIFSGLLFVVLYAVITSLVWLGPKDIFRMASALIYGAVISAFLVWLAEMINAVILFTLSRKLGREYVAGRLKGNMKRLDEAIAGPSFWSIFFLKFFPIIPFRFLDLGFGLTKISLKKYLLISAISTPLRIFFLQFFLSLGVETVMNPYKLGEYLAEKPLLWLFSFLYCFGSFGLIFYLQRRAKKSKN